MKGTETVPAEKDPGQTVLLTYVLSYADLQADNSASFPMEDDALPLVLGRAEDSRAAWFQSRSGQPESRLLLPDRWMSGRHATIRRLGDRHVVTDEGSKNGTFVNGVRSATQRLTDGDLIEIGHSLLCYRLVPRAVAASLLDSTWSRHRLGPTPSRSPEVHALARYLARIAIAAHPVLLVGEAGTGKNVAARAIHDGSPRHAGPYVHVDCGEIPEALFDATLFGLEEGASSSANERHIGLLESAHEGTLFLNEIDTLGPAAQAKLLRALRKRSVPSASGLHARKMDVRWVASMRADRLDGDFAQRGGLLQHLAEYVGRLPPLRERREDLGILASHFLREASMEGISITAPAARRLFAGSLPDNTRGLRQALVTGARLAPYGVIDLEHLPRVQREPSARPPEQDRAQPRAEPSPPAPNPGIAPRKRRAGAKRASRASPPVRHIDPFDPIRVLYLAANPQTTDVLGLGREVRKIQDKIRASEHRDAITFLSRLAVRPDDLQQVLLETRPHVVHFSGHATPDERLLLEDEAGGVAPVDKETLTELLGILKDRIRVVVFNACHTLGHAEAVTRLIEGAVGMDRAISDDAAIEFSASFYRAIGFGRSLREAFDLGRLALRIKRLPEQPTLQLRLQDGIDPSRVFLVNPR